ncbi:MAG TPA: hypothetical protein VF778_03875, partial [Xanthobacteraceae bacterium]
LSPLLAPAFADVLFFVMAGLDPGHPRLWFAVKGMSEPETCMSVITASTLSISIEDEQWRISLPLTGSRTKPA